MKYGNVTGIDKPVSRLVQGTVMLRRDDPGWSFALLDGAFEHGCTAFDTAHMYGGGESDRMLGEWIGSRGIRDRVVVLAKGAHPNRDRRRVTPHDIASDLHDTLARMKTDHVDLYLLHRDDPDLPVGPILEALNEHLRSGRICALGVSNWTCRRIDEANAYAADNGLTGFAASSPHYSLAVPAEPPWADCLTVAGPDADDDRRWYARSQMPLFAWSSLAGGFLTGRFTRDNLDTAKTYWEKMAARVYGTEENFRRLDRARALAEKSGLTVAQVALGFVFASEMNVFAVVGCHSAQEFRDNCRALDADVPADLA